jgi:P-type E1-E2 ATPase
MWGVCDVQVLPGARMPVDGVVVSGKSHADESMLTGEAEPVLKAEGSAVIGGTMNMGGTLQVSCHARSRTACLLAQHGIVVFCIAITTHSCHGGGNR